MKKRNIYQNRSQELLELFEQAGSNAKVMCVSLDYATRVFTVPDSSRATLQLSLGCHINHYRCLLESIQHLEKEIALVLSQTQGAFISSIM